MDNVLILFAAERAKNLGGYNEAFFQIPTESTPKNFSKIFKKGLFRVNSHEFSDKNMRKPEKLQKFLEKNFFMLLSVRNWKKASSLPCFRRKKNQNVIYNTLEEKNVQ